MFSVLSAFGLDTLFPLVILIKKEVNSMCRNIKVLFNFQPKATDDEINAAALQYVRKVSGFASPSAANEKVYARTVDEIARATAKLLDGLSTASAPRNREEEAARAHARAVLRFGSPPQRHAARKPGR